jgi:hypothetical protein
LLNKHEGQELDIPLLSGMLSAALLFSNFQVGGIGR